MTRELYFFWQDPTYAAMHPWYNVITDLQRDNLVAGEASMAAGCTVAIVDLSQGHRLQPRMPPAAALGCAGC